MTPVFEKVKSFMDVGNDYLDYTDKEEKIQINSLTTVGKLVLN